MLIYIILMVLILVFAVKFVKQVKICSNESYDHHRYITAKTVVFIMISLIFKFMLTRTLFSYEVNKLPLFSIAELAIICCFAIFKTNEDCFHCFDRSQEDKFSWFQLSSDQFLKPRQETLISDDKSDQSEE